MNSTIPDENRHPTSDKTRNLSREAKKRLQWFKYYETRGRNARLTCRYFGISPQTFYRWKKRYDPKNLGTLEAHSHRPLHVRQTMASAEMIETIRTQRVAHPDWGKERLSKWLRKHGYTISASTVGRIIRGLKERGILQEPPRTYASAKKQQTARSSAPRKQYGYKRIYVDHVQLD